MEAKELSQLKGLQRVRKARPPEKMAMKISIHDSRHLFTKHQCLYVYIKSGEIFLVMNSRK